MSNPTGSNWTTNVNRAKTKRWVEAKSYSYDGDDWGDADEYGEYDEPKPSTKPTGLRKATPSSSAAGLEQGQPSITERERANSFGREDERRAFSGPVRTAYAQPQPSQAQLTAQTQQPPQATQWPQSISQPGNNTRGPVQSGLYEDRTGPTTSNISIPPAIAARSGDNMGTSGQPSGPTPISTVVPPPAVGSSEPPTTTTFIRPADIYRRIAEEREKERLSQESSRPSLSNLIRDESPPGKSETSGRQTQIPQLHLAQPKPLDPSTDVSRARGPSASPLLPEISGLSGFGDEFGSSFLSSTGVSKEPAAVALAQQDKSAPQNVESSASNALGLQHQRSLGYKSVVNQAFDQAVPPTPSSTSGSNVDRSNSDSTTQISPIISREATTAVRPEGMSNIASIAEEPVGSSRPLTSGSGTKRHSGPRHTVQGDPVDIIPGHRRDTSLPSTNNSPARTPVLEHSRQLARPAEAEVLATSPIPDERSPIRERSVSPSKSRVRNLVDQIDSANNSRRGSQASLGDKVDITQPQRPSFEPKESFRPSLPGAWASYTTNSTAAPQSESTRRSPERSQASEIPQITTANEDPFAKAAAAGSALAGAFTAATGTLGAAFTSEHETARKASKVDTAFHPEAARLPLPRTESDTASSIMPTPLEMKPESNKESEYFSAIPPAQPKPDVAPSTPLNASQLQGSRAVHDLSIENSPSDLESDRLRKEIVRELSPQREEPAQDLTVPTQADNGLGYSSIYDSYLTEDDALSREPSKARDTDSNNLDTVQPTATRNNQHDSIVPVFSSTSGPLEDVPESAPVTAASHNLTRQFSWEAPLAEPKLIQLATVGAAPQSPTVPAHNTVPDTSESNDTAPTIAHQRAPSQTLDLNKQLPPPAPFTDDQSTSAVSARSSSAQSELHSTPPQHFSLDDNNDTTLPPQPQQKVPAFREIMAIQSTPQRIQVYDQTRQTFANMDTGLLQWIQSTISALPEHEDVLRSGGTFPGVVRATPGLTAAGTQASTTTSRPSLGPSTVKGVKGKDILHTAGVFGGKANSAAKGLFAKGKSKWRGGADKASKRFRGLSVNSTGDSPSKLHERENLWETDASAPYLGDNANLRTAASKASLSDHLAVPSNLNGRQNDLRTLDSLPSNSISPQTMAGLDSPTLGRSNTVGGTISPLSGNTSVRKRASFEIPGSSRVRSHRYASSVDSHRYGPKSRDSTVGELRPALHSRLTVYEKDMRSFGEEFPADLVIPAHYRIPAHAGKTSNVDNDQSAEQTPTQANFPSHVSGDKSVANETALATKLAKGSPGQASATLTSSAGIDDPSLSNTSTLSQLQHEDSGTGEMNQGLAVKQSNRPKHFSSLSFIQFDSMPNEDLTLNNLITPPIQSSNRERSDTTTSSQSETQASESSFADYPDPEQFGALPSTQSVNSVSGRDRSMSGDSYSQRYANQKTKISRQQSHSSNSTRSRSSILGKAARRLSRQNPEALDGSQGANEAVTVNKRHSTLGDVQESGEDARLGQDGRKRKSLMGLGPTIMAPEQAQNPLTGLAKFNPMSSIRKRTEPQVGTYAADANRPALTTDKSALKGQRAATFRTGLSTQSQNSSEAPGPVAQGGKRRFSGFSSLINKAKPRVGAVSNSIRGRSVTPLGTVMDSKLDSTPEHAEIEPIEEHMHSQQRPDYHLRNASQQSQVMTVSTEANRQTNEPESPIQRRTNLAAPPASHIRNAASIPDINSNRDAIINRITSPPEEGPNYKTVYPPEFFGEQPPEGYYGPEDEQGRGVRDAPVSNGANIVENTAALPRPQDDRAPPPPPPKDHPKHSVTTTTTTSHTMRGPVNTITTTGTNISQQDHYDSRLRGRQQEVIEAEPILSTDIIPPPSPPIVHNATTRTATRIANARSISPSPRDSGSSIVPVPPLKIAKRTAPAADVDIRSESSVQISHPPQTARAIAPHLTLNTQTGSARPASVEQVSRKLDENSDTAVSAMKPSARPLIAKRAPTFPRQAPESPRIQDLVSKSSDSPLSTASPASVRSLPHIITQSMKHPPSPLQSQSPVMVVQPLTIRKPTETGFKTSPNLSIPEDAIDKTRWSSPPPPVATPSTPRFPMHSPGLKDSPTLPRTIYSPASTTNSNFVSSSVPPVPILQLPSHSLTEILTPAVYKPPAKGSPPRQVTKSPLSTTQQSTTQQPKVTPPEMTPTSPIALKSNPQTTISAIVPVEKMKDEPRVTETPAKDVQSDESEDEIVMSSTAYPGQEWRPDYGYGGWDGYE